ncbi:VanZ family protein [Halorarum salinum]|uniref:VanZ family protein n=1 Tax=Halorarum salinum TaxID=2743089 RepID=A0A7D5QF23_9EURY|nr:VanZ family protein [Halobaculum salinum]QLG61102.1 VanZ family protein [Halobaculum salinum]
MRSIPVPLFPRSLRWLGVCAVVVVISYFSLGSVPPEPPTPTPIWDKHLHFISYAGLALALAYATVDHYTSSRRRVLVLGGAIAFGVLIELLQGTTPHRYFGWGDLLANALGAALASLWFVVERVVRYVPILDSD